MKVSTALSQWFILKIVYKSSLQPTTNFLFTLPPLGKHQKEFHTRESQIGHWEQSGYQRVLCPIEPQQLVHLERSFKGEKTLPFRQPLCINSTVSELLERDAPWSPILLPSHYFPLARDCSFKDRKHHLKTQSKPFCLNLRPVFLSQYSKQTYSLLLLLCL